MNHFAKSAIAISLLLIGLPGCSKEEMQDMVSQAKDAATSATATVSESVQDATENAVAQATEAVETAGDLSGVADMTGKATMTLDGPTEFGASYVRLIKLNPGRPAVLQIKSYKDGEVDAFPSFLVQAQVEATDLASLAGKPIPAKVYAQKTATGPVWHSADDAPASLSLTVVEGKVTAKIESAELLNTDNGQRSPTSASFECASLD